jgi:predicted nuclease with RNAse H fold
MSGGGPLWVGADPGGKGNFGIAILTEGDQPQTSSVDCADEAVAFVRKHLDRTPAGVGVDAPLWWSSGISGDRHADRWLRRQYGLAGGEVQAANSLRGAALTQGAMFIQRMRETYPAVPVTETHPKALLKALTQGDWKAFAGRFGLKTAISNDHERDALIAAVSAREGFQGRWPHDLSIRRLPAEQDPRSYWLAPVHYFWPEE